jgi:hypothetical protein
LAAESGTGAAALVVGAGELVTVDTTGATAPAAGTEGPTTAGAEGCIEAVDGCAGVAVAEDAAWLAGSAPTVLAEEVVAGGAGGGVD